MPVWCMGFTGIGVVRWIRVRLMKVGEGEI
jgi:hypothetical protein